MLALTAPSAGGGYIHATRGIGLAYAQADDTPPTVESAEVDGTTLKVTFSETLRKTNTSGLQWALWVDGIVEGAPVIPVIVSISDKTLTLVLARAAAAGQTVTVNYDARVAEEKL